MTKFLVGLEKFLHSLTHSFCRHIVKTFTFLYLFLKQQKVLHLFCQHPTSKNPVVSMTTGFSFCLFGEVFPLVFPYESEKDSFFTTRHAFNEVIHAF